MKKGIISLAIVLAMVVSMFVPAFAAEDVAEPLVIDFANFEDREAYPIGVPKDHDAGANPRKEVGNSAYDAEEGAWKIETTGVMANAEYTELGMHSGNVFSATTLPADLTGYTHFALIYKTVSGAEGGVASFKFRTAGGAVSGVVLQGSDDYTKGVVAIPAGGMTGFVVQFTNSLGESAHTAAGAANGALRPVNGDIYYIAAIAFFADEDSANAFDLEAYREENAPVIDNNIYFDKNLNNENVSQEDGVSIIIDKTFADLGGFRCTTHLTNYGEGCLADEEFFEEGMGGYLDPVIKCQVTKNAKYAKVEAEYVDDFGEGEGGVRFTVTPIDNYIAKDIEIEVQMYVIRNQAYQAHKSNTVKFELEILNRYIEDDDIAAIAGEDCSLFIDETAYAVKGSQFEEAGDKSVSIAWWNAETPDINDFVVSFESVVGQNGINFGWAKVETADLPASVTGLSKLAHWAGIAFESEEVIVNGATVSVYNNFGAGFKYAYTLDAEGNLAYVGEVKFEEYAEFEVEAGEALGTFLFSNQKFETAPVEPEEPDEDDKEAPGTGAGANMMGLAVFAVVALAGAAVVASKK